MGLSAGLIVLAILGGAALVRAWAARRVRGGDRRLAPTLLLSTLLIVLVLAGVGVWLAVRSLLLGIPATVGALLLGGAWLRVSLDTVRFGDPAPRGRDRMDDLADRASSIDDRRPRGIRREGGQRLQTAGAVGKRR